MGTTENIQVRIEGKLTEYFYNETQHAFAETRIITKRLTLKFLGPQPMIFKPGMSFEGQVSVMFNEVIPIDGESLRTAKLTLTFEDQNADIFQTFTYDPNDDMLNDEALKRISKRYNQDEFRSNGLLSFKVDSTPVDAEQLKISALIETEEFGQARKTTYAFKAFADNDRYIHVRSSTKKIAIGNYAIFHVKTNFPFEYFDWVITSKNLIIQTGNWYFNMYPKWHDSFC